MKREDWEKDFKILMGNAKPGDIDIPIEYDEIRELLRNAFNQGISYGWKQAWQNIRDLLNPIYKNTREKPRYEK